MIPFYSVIRNFVGPLLLFLVTVSGCIHKPYARPAGNMIGSCEGTMKMVSGQHSRFAFQLYRLPDAEKDQFRLYFMLRGKTGLLPVEDLDFDENMLCVVAGSNTSQVFKGRITGSPLDLKGSLKGFEGAFTIDIKQFLDK